MYLYLLHSDASRVLIADMPSGRPETPRIVEQHEVIAIQNALPFRDGCVMLRANK